MPAVCAGSGNGFSWLDLDGPLPPNPFEAVPEAVVALAGDAKAVLGALGTLKQFQAEDMASEWAALVPLLAATLRPPLECTSLEVFDASLDLHWQLFQRAPPRQAADLGLNAIAALEGLGASAALVAAGADATLVVGASSEVERVGPAVSSRIDAFV